MKINTACERNTCWARGIEGQRRSDLGDGTFLNPIISGDHPDPSILKDLSDYYMTFSTFEAYPGLTIWHSRDLINWQPIVSALRTNIGSVWAPELCRHEGRFYLYIPTKQTSIPGTRTTCWVIWADDIRGPWSDPIDLNLPKHIDPGHAVGEDGRRYLFLSAGDRVLLADDGLSVVGGVEHVYDPWRYPDDWDVEGFSPEGPKVLRHGEYFYLVLAVGGTAGPPTGHMVIAARSRSIHGPWEQHPRNPLVRTTDASEQWWSRGHATLVEGPAGDWWTVYHGYENGFMTLGRQTLLAPVIWTDDGWFDIGGGDLSRSLAKPLSGSAEPQGGNSHSQPQGNSVAPPAHGIALSDDFSTDKYGLQWHFFKPSADEASRIIRDGDGLVLTARGTAPKDSSPLLFVTGDRSYEIEADIEISAGSWGGLLLFYDQGLYCGLGFDSEKFITHQYGLERGRPLNPYGRRLHIRLRTIEHIVSYYTSADGESWKRFDRGMEVSGYHHNVRGGFLMLKPGFYAAGEGEVRIKDFRYRAL